VRVLYPRGQQTIATRHPRILVHMYRFMVHSHRTLFVSELFHHPRSFVRYVSVSSRLPPFRHSFTCSIPSCPSTTGSVAITIAPYHLGCLFVSNFKGNGKEKKANLASTPIFRQVPWDKTAYISVPSHRLLGGRHLMHGSLLPATQISPNR